MNVLFLCVALVGICYFTLVKRRFDFLAVGFFSACLYFLPGFVGFTAYPKGVLFQWIPIEDATYGATTIVLAAWILIALLADRVPDAIRARPMTGGSQPWATYIATAGALLGFTGSVLTTGAELLSPDKVALLAQLNRWHLLWANAAMIGALLAFVSGRRVALAANLLLLLANLYVGFRVELAIAAVAILSLWLFRLGPVRLVRYWGFGLATLAAASFFFLYKHVQFAIKVGDFDLIVRQLQNTEALRLVFINSEPFAIHGILNEVIAADFRTGIDQLAQALFALVPFADSAGADVHSFNEAFQPVLFSSVTEFGLANSIWAQMYSVGTWPLLMGFALLLASTVAVGSSVLRTVGPEGRAIAALVLSYLAFYVHRNDLLYELILVRRVILIGLVCVVLGFGVRLLVGWIERDGRAPAKAAGVR